MMIQRSVMPRHAGVPSCRRGAVTEQLLALIGVRSSCSRRGSRPKLKPARQQIHNERSATDLLLPKLVPAEGPCPLVKCPSNTPERCSASDEFDVEPRVPIQSDRGGAIV